MPRTSRARSDDAWAGLSAVFANLENAGGGRLGVAVFDVATGANSGDRSTELFPMCSTFKLLAAAAILKRVEAGQESLQRRIPFDASDLVVNSPTTSARVGEGSLTLAEICEVAMIVSDNGNLLLASDIG